MKLIHFIWIAIKQVLSFYIIQLIDNHNFKTSSESEYPSSVKYLNESHQLSKVESYKFSLTVNTL